MVERTFQKNAGRMPALRRSEVLPDFAVGLYLEYAAFVRVQKIVADGNAVGVGGLDRAAGPASRTNATAVLLGLDNDMKTVIDAIFDASGSRGY